MNEYDIKCRIIEEELKTFWPQWHVVKRIGGGSFSDVFRICSEKYGIRVESALKVIQVTDETDTISLLSTTQGEMQGDKKEVSGTADGFSRQQSEKQIQFEKAVTASGSDTIPEALRNEIQIMEALRGAPNIVVIDDFYFRKSDSVNSLFVRMELLTSFQEVLLFRQKNNMLFSLGEVIKIGRDICTALMYCEKKCIIHRDLKPANFFVDGFGNYKVGDFGVSKRMDTVYRTHTMTGIGTISYMAPEIFKGQSYNNTVDIYALGLILYQILNNGRIPFLPTSGSYSTRDIDSANYRRLHGEPVPSLAGIPAGDGSGTVDPSLDAIIRKAFAHDPGDRYQTAREFRDALDAWETAQGNAGQINRISTEKTVKSNRNKNRKTWPVYLIAALGILILLTGVRTFKRNLETENTAQSGINALSDQDNETPDTDSPQKEETDAGQAVIDSSEADREEEEEYTPDQVSLSEISDSWEEIIAAGEDGTYADKYRIGDTKMIDLGEEGLIRMELAAMDADELADGNGYARMTWIAKDLINSDHSMNPDGTNEGGWQESDIRFWLRENVLPLFPEEVRSNIKEVTKYSYSRSEKGIVASADKIWIPSVREMLGGDSWEDRGPDYLEAFPDDESRHKYHIGAVEPSWWWLRSTSGRREDVFSSVHYYGDRFGDSAGTELGVAIGFCL